jgi:hypothetical protein
MTEYKLHNLRANSLVFQYGADSTEMLRISAEGITANPNIDVDDAARVILKALDRHIKDLVANVVDKERKACRDAVEKARAYNVFWYPKGYTVSANSINEFYEHQHKKCLEAIDGL